MDLDLAGDDQAFDLPSPLPAGADSPFAAAAQAGLAGGAHGAAGGQRRRKGLPVHRCRFPDWAPASVSALALTPTTFDAGLLGLGGDSDQRGVLAVGRANGDVELMVWGGHQGWIAWRTLPSSFPLPSQRTSRKPTSLLSHLVFTHQTTLSSGDLDLYEGDVEGAEQEVRRLRREGVRLFGVGGVGSELVEWEWGGPGSGKAVGMVKSTLPTLPPIFAIAASRASSTLAIACEDSTIRILNIMDGELELVSKIEVGGPGKVRALSLAWAPPTAPVSKGKEREDASTLPEHLQTPNETYLVAGCSNSTIRRFDAPPSGSVAGVWRGGARMTLDRLKGEHTVVWTIAVLEDGTVVSGDSMGNVKFWDGSNGTQAQSFRAHKADVLALALGSDGSSLFTSGVDQKTVEFRRVTVASARVHDVPVGRWIQASGRRLHSHDVRAIVVSPPYALPLPFLPPSDSLPKKTLVPVMTSAGLDLSLILTPVSPAPSSSSSKKRTSSAALANPVSDVPLTEFESTTHRRAAYVPQRARPFAVAAGSGAPDSPRLLVCRRERGVGIWRLEDPKRAGSTNGGLGANAAPLSRVKWGRKKMALGLDAEEEEEDDEEVGTTGYEKVAELDLKVQTNLIASAVSPDGRWLAVSDLYETKLFRLSWRNGELVPRRQKAFADTLAAGLPSSSLGTGSSCIAFTRDSQRMVLSTAFDAATAVVQLPPGKEEEFELVAVFDEGVRSRLNGVVNGKAEADGEDVEMNGGSHSDTDSDSSDDDDAPSSGPTKRTPPSVVCLAVSSDGRFVATAESDRAVKVYDVASHKLHATLPTPLLVPTWLAFTPSASNTLTSGAVEPTLILALPSNALLLYGLTSHRFHPWALPLSSRKYNTLMDLREPALGVAFEPRRADSLSASTASSPAEHVHPSRRAAVQSGGAESSVAVVWGANWVAKIDVEALRRDGGSHAVADAKAGKGKKGAKGAAAAAHARRDADRKRAREDDDDLVGGGTGSKAADEPKPLEIRVTRRYQPLVLFDFVGQGELVAVERTWFDVARDLPQAWVKAGQFGT
ncbi:small subunit rRNA maturation protein UTP4 [Rhodotorula paludigena]|uniref:small subunit rRNA maturation protein UTP4 n=1 Tax=Rhodotorula paludigena TaxID=86838 RepID=UPI003178F42E